MTYREHAFGVWAPVGGIWSPWVKPVLFAHVNPAPLPSEVLPNDTSESVRIPNCGDQCALVLDLPADRSVVLGLQFARQGFRPVPLYNALPSSGAAGAPSAVCDVWPIIEALTRATPQLESLKLPDDAPPAFLLDSQRLFGTGVRPAPGMFDNRSVSLSTDFPSANRLISMNIRRVILVQDDALIAQMDLAHTLLRWKEAGIQIDGLNLKTGEPPIPIPIPKPSMYRALWQRLLATVGLRRNPLGGFGGTLPIPSSGG